METKRCPKCGEIKPFDEFNKNRTRKYGISSLCKLCGDISKRESNEKSKSRVLVLMPSHKHCSRCKAIKSSDSFRLDKISKDGLSTWCKNCEKEYMHQYHKAHHIPKLRNKVVLPEGMKKCSDCKIIKNVNEFNNNKSEKDGKCSICKECVKTRHRNYYKSHRDKKVNYSREYRKNNIETILYYNKKYKEENLEWSREYARSYSHKRRAKESNNGGEYTVEQYSMLENYYCPIDVCLSCGKQAKLTADHVIPVIKGGSSNISNIQPICHSCNSRKHIKVIDYRPDGGAYAKWIEENIK